MDKTKEEILNDIKDICSKLDIKVEVSMQDRKSVLEEEFQRVSDLYAGTNVINEPVIEPEPVEVKEVPIVEEIKLVEVNEPEEDLVTIIFSQATTIYRKGRAVNCPKGSKLKITKSEYKQLRHTFSLSGLVPFDTDKALLMRDLRQRRGK